MITEHFELGRRPSQPAYSGKVDRESGCGFLEATKRANSVDPPSLGGFLFSASVIHPDLIQAYLDTHYHVRQDKPFVIRIGQLSSELDALHQLKQVQSSCFITPCNPVSAQLKQVENNQKLREFQADKLLQGLELVNGLGQHPTNSWEGEESCLVLGITLEKAKEVGRKYDQNAIVWIGSDVIPELVLLR